MGCLMQTVCMNPGMADRVHAYKVALVDKGEMEMCLWSTNKMINNGNARLTPAFNGSKDWDNDKGVQCMEYVQSSTLDRLLFESTDAKLTRRPLIMKMDIEGSETKTLQGATRLLASDFAPCLIFFEHQRVPTETTGAAHGEIFDILTSANYTIYDAVASAGAYTRAKWEQVHVGDFRAVLSCGTHCWCRTAREKKHEHTAHARNFDSIVLKSNDGDHDPTPLPTSRGAAAPTVLIFTMDSLTTQVQAAKDGGPAGEIVVRESLQQSLRASGCTVDVATSDDHYAKLTRHQTYDILIFDPWTVLEKQNRRVQPRALAQRHQNNVFVLDFFGTASNMLGLPSSHILAAFQTLSATFLGFSLDQVNARVQVSQPRGIIWGKEERYYA